MAAIRLNHLTCNQASSLGGHSKLLWSELSLGAVVDSLAQLGQETADKTVSSSVRVLELVLLNLRARDCRSLQDTIEEEAYGYRLSGVGDDSDTLPVEVLLLVLNQGFSDPGQLFVHVYYLQFVLKSWLNAKLSGHLSGEVKSLSLVTEYDVTVLQHFKDSVLLVILYQLLCDCLRSQIESKQLVVVAGMFGHLQQGLVVTGNEEASGVVDHGIAQLIIRQHLLHV